MLYKFLPTHIVVLVDFLLSTIAILIAWNIFLIPDLLFFSFQNIEKISVLNFFATVFFISISYNLFLLIYKFHQNVFSFSSFKDFSKLFKILFITLIFQYVTFYVLTYFSTPFISFNLGLLFCFLFVFLTLASYRFFVTRLYNYFYSIEDIKENACVYGDSIESFAITHSISKIENPPFKLYSLLIENNQLEGKMIYGVQVHKRNEPVIHYLENNNIKHFFFDKAMFDEKEYYDFLKFSIKQGINLYALKLIENKPHKFLISDLLLQ